jgi:hypothetical protein
MQSSFETMSKVELRAYVIANPGDQEAFYMFIDRFASTPTEIYSGGAEEVKMLVKKKVAELRNNSQS